MTPQPPTPEAAEKAAEALVQQWIDTQVPRDPPPPGTDPRIGATQIFAISAPKRRLLVSLFASALVSAEERERERCAKIADARADAQARMEAWHIEHHEDNGDADLHHGDSVGSRALAAAIRARPTPKVQAWSCPRNCGHPESDHVCHGREVPTDRPCTRGCHGHDGSDGPCDCPVKIVVSSTPKAPEGASDLVGHGDTYGGTLETYKAPDEKMAMWLCKKEHTHSVTACRVAAPRDNVEVVAGGVRLPLGHRCEACGQPMLYHVDEASRPYAMFCGTAACIAWLFEKPLAVAAPEGGETEEEGA